MVVEDDSMNSINTLITNIKQQIKAKNHPYIQENLDDYPIDDQKILLLVLMLQSKQLSNDHIEKYVVTVFLIIAALDIHDLVSNDNHIPDFKERQLTVLAGDYYSGLYYKTLADIPNIEMIRYLAEGIRIVNEHKLFIYKGEQKTTEEFMNSMKLIETAIFQKVAEFFHEPVWGEFTENWLFLQLLQNEQEKIKTYLEKNVFNTRNVDSGYGFDSISEKIMNEYMEKIHVRINTLQNQMPQMNNFNKKLTSSLNFDESIVI
ncbi:heptaprenyl diphosphate synthase component 1 [Bacillus kwashiorkori]|uniref:heptaprenyl diphosphate synthase component 1 n=1 Tax=Bacillus kwashiorkori TaxID=1522318 RepID=UPI000782A6E0|nr:heptaprenyl diphosphate synthase component 1 [Bacillus kwashiorkori]